MEAFLIEAELLLDWYLIGAGAPATTAARAAFVGLWREALVPAIAAPPTWVLRDYHSPNLLWLTQRDDIARIGVLDFQDALIGPAAYDVASLLQDARVDVPEAMEMALLGRYVRARLERGSCIRHRRLHARLCDAGGATGDQNSRHLRPARPARRQTAISASHAPPMELFAALAGAPGAWLRSRPGTPQMCPLRMGYDIAIRVMAIAGRAIR